MSAFTPTQGRYLAYIHAYTTLHGYPPAESEIAAAMCVSAPSVNQMVKTLEKRGLIQRRPGESRTIRVIIPEEEIPAWNKRGKSTHQGSNPRPRPSPAVPIAPPAKLYVMSVFLTGGPTSEKFANKVIQRVIEIRGDQTLEQLHEMIFQAYDRWDPHAYEFQFGKRPFDPEGLNYGTSPSTTGKNGGDARTTTLDDLGLTNEKVFGYWFDFGEDWFHQIQVDKIEQAIPTVVYPRVTRRVGKSPPQYDESTEE